MSEVQDLGLLGGGASALAVLFAQREVLERIVAGDPLQSALTALVEMIEGSSDQGVLGSVLLLDPDGRRLRHAAAPSLPERYNKAVDGLPIGPRAGSCGTAAFRRQQVVVEDVTVDPLWEDFRHLAADAGVRACWSTPVFAADRRLLGTFAMYYPEPRRPTASDLALIDVLVRTAAIAIERARADEGRAAALERERLARRAAVRAHSDLNFVLDATTRIASSLDYEATLGRLAELAVPTLADLCVIDVVEHGRIRRAAAAGAQAEAVLELPPVPGGGHPTGRVLASGNLEYASNILEPMAVLAARDDVHRAIVRQLGITSYMCLPLTARGSVFGTLTLVAGDSGRHYEERDVAVARELAGRAALVIDNARLHQATAAAERRLSLVARAGAALTSSLDLDSVLGRLCDLLVPDVGAACEVHVWRRDGRLRRRGFGPSGMTPGEDAAHLPLLVDETVRSGAIRSVGALTGAAVGRLLQPATAGGDVTGATVVPLIAHGEVVGALAVAAVAGAGGFGVDADVLPVLAGRAALAIDNARVYEAERSTAETLQHTLLPQRLPEVEGLQVAARYEPGGDVGGDWYDVLPLPGRRVGLAIGDVMGRGIQAAATMGQLRNALRALALQDLTPDRVLHLVDRFFRAEDDSGLATLFYAVADLESSIVTCASAGHCPALVLSPGAPPRWLADRPGPPLGAPRRDDYRRQVLQLRLPSVLLLYTDGLVERRDQSLTDRLDLLAQVAAGIDIGTADAEQVCATVAAALGTDRADADDTALLVLRFTDAA